MTGRSASSPRSEDRKALVVTGAASGIGKAIATLAIQQGWIVFGSVRRDADGQAMTQALGTAFTPLLFDVRDEAAIARAVKVVSSALGSRTLTALVNNAGVGYSGPLLHQPLQEFAQVIDTNLTGPLLVTRAFVPLLGADQGLSGGKGRIVNISSIAGKVGQPFAGAYVASKHALEGLSEVMRRELNLYGIRVVVVAPATVDTPIWNAPECSIGRYDETDYGSAFNKGVRAIVDAGHRHGLAPEDVAETIMTALTARRPRLRYAPAQHFVAEQALPRVSPSRVTDVVIEHALGLVPLPHGKLIGIKA